MAIGDRKTVWILGAGFSRSLGAPLLATLFRQQNVRDFTGVGVKDSLVQDLVWTQMIFNHGRRDGLWEDAEVFLAFADDAWARKPPDDYKRREFARLVETCSVAVYGLAAGEAERSYSNVPRVVRRALAFETSRFLKYANPKEDEAWGPYLSWAKRLRLEFDTVVTFNYDRVPEMLRLFVPLPHQAEFKDQMPVYKMHGSTDWVINRSDPQNPRVEQNLVAIENDLELGLAPPGGSKASLTETLFWPLWDAAIKAIREAAEIVIVGYSFPKTDALAKKSILDAMDSAESKVSVRQAHLVLGPDVNSDVNARVLELLRHRMGPKRQVFVNLPATRSITYGGDGAAIVTQHRLWAEDFIADYQTRAGPAWP